MNIQRSNHPLGNRPPGGGGGSDWRDLPELFQPDLYPKNGSYNGLSTDARDMLADRVAPILLDTLVKLPGHGIFERDHQKMAYQRYRHEGDNALENALPDVLNQLVNRNIFNSSVYNGL